MFTVKIVEIFRKIAPKNNVFILHFPKTIIVDILTVSYIFMLFASEHVIYFLIFLNSAIISILPVSFM